MDRYAVTRWLLEGSAAIALAICLVALPRPASGAQETFESEDFVVTFANRGDTPETLAQKFLGDRAKGWMIEDYNGTGKFSPSQEVIIPKRPWNPAGVEPNGYQLIPVLVYHNIGPQAKGRLLIAAKTFEEQMRYLKAQGYRVVSLKELHDFMSLRRQLPGKSVVLTFDDGYKSFREYAYPLLKELGFPATLFAYTDYVGTGRNALTWEELKNLQREGFDVQAHSKTHSDLRRKPGESDAEYAARMKAELELPRTLFQRNLGTSPQILAYPYGGYNDEVVKTVKEYGYVAAFSVLRQGNPSFDRPLEAHRSQVYSEMSLQDFVKNLNTFSQEAIR